MERKTSAGTLMLGLDPGIIVGLPGEHPEQTLGTIKHEGSAKASKMDALEWSEVLRSLEVLQ